MSFINIYVDKETILSILNYSEAYTVTEIIQKIDEEDVRNQEISALLNQLMDENKVVKTVEKRKSYFYLA